MNKRFIIRSELIRANAVRAIAELPLNPPHLIVIEEFRAKRSLDQNAFLHAVPLELISDHTGIQKDELKEYLLGEAFGWQEVEVFGSKRQVPLRRSHTLNTKEFSWFIEWIEQWAAQTLNLIIPRPNEELK